MHEEQRRAGNYISMIDRLSRIFYARHYAGYPIGSGQQYFLLWIYEKPGITAGHLAQHGQYDKGTTAKAVQKLVDCGYIRVESDPRDQRRRHLYPLPAADKIVREIYAARAAFETVLARDFTEQERTLFEALLCRAAENARQEVSDARRAAPPNEISRTPCAAE